MLQHTDSFWPWYRAVLMHWVGSGNNKYNNNNNNNNNNQYSDTVA